jgi:phosphoribosylformylglycinamidine synthase
VEAGYLPSFGGISAHPTAALATNMSSRFECRWIYLKHENNGKCIFTQKTPKNKVVRMPVAHAEGRFILPKEGEKEYLSRLCDNDQLVFRYCDEEGNYAEGEYPLNPNGSLYDIAGICDPQGTIFGLMPHPERAYYGWQLPDWTAMDRMPENGDGKAIFESLVEYVEKKF